MTPSPDTDRPSSKPNDVPNDVSKDISNDVPNAGNAPGDDTLPNVREEQRRPRDYLLVSLKGMAIGACDVIPGVSGGTMALILGIYEELIESLHTLGQPSFLAAVLRLRVREVFARLNWRFLLALLVGIGVAVLSLARSIEWLLANHEVLLWSFFFGLIAASVVTVSERVERWHAGAIAAFILGSVGAFVLVGLSPAESPEAAWFLFLSGALAISALILPGISGAFILVLLGKYEFILGAVSRFDIATIAVVGLGAAVGLVSFVQLLYRLFERAYNLTIALLCGFMLGSLRKIWPWQETTAELTTRNVWPPLDPQVVYALLLAVLGFGLIFVADRVQQRYQRS